MTAFWKRTDRTEEEYHIHITEPSTPSSSPTPWWVASGEWRKKASYSTVGSNFKNLTHTTDKEGGFGVVAKSLRSPAPPQFLTHHDFRHADKPVYLTL